MPLGTRYNRSPGLQKQDVRKCGHIEIVQGASSLFRAFLGVFQGADYAATAGNADDKPIAVFSLQCLSGFTKPSQANEAAFDRAK